jgi:hypothetical protein
VYSLLIIPMVAVSYDNRGVAIPCLYHRPRGSVVGLCLDSLPCGYILGLCPDHFPWVSIVGLCLDRFPWVSIVGLCLDRFTWGSTVGVCLNRFPWVSIVVHGVSLLVLIRYRNNVPTFSVEWLILLLRTLDPISLNFDRKTGYLNCIHVILLSFPR